MASNVLVTVSYKVNKVRSTEYLNLAQGFIGAVNGSQSNVKVSLYMDNDDEGSFVELYECPTPDSYDQLEDSYNDSTHDLVAKMAGYVQDRQVVRTLIQKG
jgi:hypothetical protein